MSPELSSSFSDCGYYMPMRAVQTVEIAYADDGRLPVGRDFIETAEDAHQISNRCSRMRKSTWIGIYDFSTSQVWN